MDYSVLIFATRTLDVFGNSIEALTHSIEETRMLNLDISSQEIGEALEQIVGVITIQLETSVVLEIGEVTFREKLEQF